MVKYLTKILHVDRGTIDNCETFQIRLYFEDLGRDNPRMGPIHFVKNVLQKWTLFLAGPHMQAIQISCQLCSNVDIKDSWAHQILQRAHKNFQWPI